MGIDDQHYGEILYMDYEGVYTTPKIDNPEFPIKGIA